MVPLSKQLLEYFEANTPEKKQNCKKNSIVG